MNQIVIFDEVKLQIEEYKKENLAIVFDYDDPQGNKDARSHIFKLRKTKTTISEIHKEAKADALAVCKSLDTKKRDLIADVDEMIEVHATPIKAIEEKIRQEDEAKVAAILAEKERVEAERLAALEKREAEIAAKESEFQAKEAAVKAEQEKVQRQIEQAEREKRIAEEVAAKTKAEIEYQAAAEKAEQARKTAKAEESERLRQSDITHRSEIEASVKVQLYHVIGESDITEAVMAAIVDSNIDHLRIQY